MPERPRVEARDVVAGEDEATLRQVLQPSLLEAEEPAQEGPGGGGDQAVEKGGPHQLEYSPSRAVAIVTSRADRRKTPAPRHRRVARKGEDDRGLPRQGLRRRVERRPHPRPSRARGRHSGGVQEAGVGPARRRRRPRVRAPLHRRSGQAEEGERAEEAACRIRRAPARDGRGPRGRGDRLAPAPGAEAEGPGAADGLPRDHPRRDRARARRDARGRPAARRRAGDAAHPRPALRLRDLAGAVEEDHARSLRRPRAVRGDAARGRARARADGVRGGRLVGSPRDVRSGVVRGAARRARREARRDGPRLRPGRKAEGRRRAAARRGHRPRAGRPARRCVVHASAASSRSRTCAGRTRRS